MQLLLQFYSDSCETLLVFRAWSEDVHIVWISCSDYFCHFFHKMNLVIFRLKLIDTMYLVYATPPTVYSDSFETLHAFRSWSEDAHILGRELLRVLLPPPPPKGELCRLCFLKHDI